MDGDELGLVADIGRVSVRFGLTGGGYGIAPREIRSYHTADHPTFTSALVSYLSELNLQNAHLPSALAVAGVARGDLINLTGSRWYISLAGVEAVLRRPPRALNECAATALALTTLSPTAFNPLPGPLPKAVQPGGNYLLIAAGTGLGVAALITSGDRLIPIQSEAGHMSFAASSPAEAKFNAYVASKGQQASNETLLGANGLVTAYAALSGKPTPPGMRPEDVTRAMGRDPIAAETVRLWADHLGALVGDLVLAFGAWDGVFLSGPIARFVQPQLSDPGFRRRMEGKSAFRRQLGEVPVAVVNRTDLELLGAAAALTSA